MQLKHSRSVVQLSHLCEGGLSALGRLWLSATLRCWLVSGLHCNGGRRTAGFYQSSCCSPSPYKENFPHSAFWLVLPHPLGVAHADNGCALTGPGGAATWKLTYSPSKWSIWGRLLLSKTYSISVFIITTILMVIIYVCYTQVGNK